MRNYKKVITYLVVTLLVVGLIPTGNVSYAVPEILEVTSQEELLTTTHLNDTQEFQIDVDKTFTTPSAVTVMMLGTPTGVSANYDDVDNQLDISLEVSATIEYFEVMLYDDPLDAHKVKIWVDYYARNIQVTRETNPDVNLDKNGLRVMYYDLTHPINSSANPSGTNTVGYEDSYGIQRYSSDTIFIKQPLLTPNVSLGLLERYKGLFDNTTLEDFTLYYTYKDSSPDINGWQDNPYYQGAYNWGYFIPRYTGYYSIGSNNDDGVDFAIQDDNGLNTFVEWWNQAPNTDTIGELHFTAGKAYPIDVAFYENNKVEVSFILMFMFEGASLPTMTPDASYYHNDPYHPASVEPIPAGLLFPANSFRAPEHNPPELVVDPMSEEVLMGSSYTIDHGVTYANGTLQPPTIVFEETPGNFVSVPDVNTNQLGHYQVTFEVVSDYDSNVTISETRDVYVIPGKDRVGDFVYFIGKDGELVRYYPFVYDASSMKYGTTVEVTPISFGYPSNKYSSIGTLMNGRVLGNVKDNGNKLFIDIDTNNHSELTWTGKVETNAMTIDDNDIIYMVKNGTGNQKTYIHRYEIDEINGVVTPYGDPINIKKWDALGDIEIYGNYAFILVRDHGSNSNDEYLLRVDLGSYALQTFDIDPIKSKSYGLTEVRDMYGNEDFMLFAMKGEEVYGILVDGSGNASLSLTKFKDVAISGNDLEDGARGIPRGETNLILDDLTLYETETGNVFNPTSVLAGYAVSYELVDPAMSAYLSLNPMTGDVEALEYYPTPIEVKAILHDGFGTTATSYVTILDLFYTIKVTGDTTVYVPDVNDPEYDTKLVPYSYTFTNQLGDSLALIDPEWMITTQSATNTVYAMTTTPSTNQLIVPSTGESEVVHIGISGTLPEDIDEEVYWDDPLQVNVIRNEIFKLTISGDTPITIPGKDEVTPATEIYNSTLTDNFETDYTTASTTFVTLMMNPSNMSDPNLGTLFFSDNGDDYYIYSYDGIAIDNNGLVSVSPYTTTSHLGSLYIGVEYTEEGIKGVMQIATVLAPLEYVLDVDGPVSHFIPVSSNENVTPFTYSLSHQYADGLSLTNPVWDVDGYGVSIDDPNVHNSTMIVTPAAEDPIVSPDTSIVVTVSVYGDEYTTPVEHDVTLIKQDPNLILTIIGDEEIQIPMTGEVQEIYNFTYTDQYLTARQLQPDSQEWSISGNLPGVELVGSTLVVNASTQPHMVAITLTGKDLETGQDVIDVHYVSIMPKQIIPTLYIEGAGSIVIPGTLEADNSENYNFYLRLMVPDVTVDTELHTLSVSYNIVDILVPSDAATTWALTSPYNGVSAQETSASSGYVNVTSGTQVGIVTGLASVSDFSMDVFDEYDVYPDEYALQASKDINLIKSPVPTRLEIKGATELLIPRFYDPDTTSTYTVHLYDQYDEEMDLDDVWWDLATSYNGITFDPETGLITVTGDASSNSFMINAGWPYSPEENGNGDGEFSLRTVGPEFILEDNHIVDLSQLPIDYYDLNIVIVGNGSVDVTPDPDEEEEGYMHGTAVDLVPTAGPGFSFAGFSGPVSGNQIIMDNNYTITATFTADEEPPAPTVNLTITVVGDGVVSPGSANFTVGSVVQLAFTPADGWEFSSVTGPVDGNNQIVMDTDYAITVTFDEVIDIPDDEVPLAAPTAQTFTLDVYVVGQGTVSPNYGIYDAGAIATFTPVASEGWEFTGYNIQAIANNQLVMDQDYIVVAIFEEIIEIPEDEVPLAELPQTGGIGQLFFYLIGGMMMLLGAAMFMRRNRSHN